MQMMKVKDEIAEEKRKLSEEEAQRESKRLLEQLKKDEGYFGHIKPYDHTRGTPIDEDVVKKRETVKDVSIVITDYFRPLSIIAIALSSISYLAFNKIKSLFLREEKNYKFARDFRAWLPWPKACV